MKGNLMDRMSLYRALEGRFRTVLATTPNPRDIKAATLTDAVFEVLREAPVDEGPGCPDDALAAALGEPLSEWVARHGAVSPEELAAALHLVAGLEGGGPGRWRIGSALAAAEGSLRALTTLKERLDLVRAAGRLSAGRAVRVPNPHGEVTIVEPPGASS